MTLCLGRARQGQSLEPWRKKPLVLHSWTSAPAGGGRGKIKFYLKENKPRLESQLYRAEHLLDPSLSFLSWRRKSTLDFHAKEAGDQGRYFEPFSVSGFSAEPPLNPLLFMAEASWVQALRGCWEKGKKGSFWSSFRNPSSFSSQAHYS